MKKNIVRFLVAALVVALSAVSCPLDAGDAGTYYVAYNSNNGTGTMENSTFTVGVPGNLRQNTFTRTGYVFEGWATTGGGAVAYTDGASVTDLTVQNGATVPLYAVWSAADTDITISGVSVKFRRIPAGSFQRDSDPGNISVITKNYWMSETEVTQELFLAVMGKNPSSFTSGADASEVQGKRPVESVSWYDAIAFCNKLSLADNRTVVYSISGSKDPAIWEAIPSSDNTIWDAVTMDTGANGYRLPTEMEWMWAAMGADRTIQPNTSGYSKAFAGSDGSNSVGDYAWYDGDAGLKTHEVGKKNANEIGLYDMSGNVWEWCWDWYDGTSGLPGKIADSGTVTDYTGAAASGKGRVVRGGAWLYNEIDDSLTYRFGNFQWHRQNNYGFRLVRP